VAGRASRTRKETPIGHRHRVASIHLPKRLKRAALILGPIAVSAAIGAGVNPQAMGVAVAMACSAALLGLVTGLLLGVVLMPGVSLERRLYLALHGICAQSHNLISD